MLQYGWVGRGGRKGAEKTEEPSGLDCHFDDQRNLPILAQIWAAPGPPHVVYQIPWYPSTMARGALVSANQRCTAALSN